MCLLTHSGTRCVQSHVYVPGKKIRWPKRLSLENAKNFKEKSELELQAGVMAVRLKEQVFKDLKLNIYCCSFLSESTAILQRIQRSHRKK